jgi:hypothetical protein
MEKENEVPVNNFLLSEESIEAVVSGVSVRDDSPGDSSGGDGTNDSSAQ